MVQLLHHGKVENRLNQIAEELRQTLDEELGIYQRLLSLAHNKKKLLLEKFSIEFQNIVTQEEGLVQRLLTLEQSRIEHIIAIAGDKEVTLDAALENLSSADQKSDLWMLGSQLKDVMLEVKKVNDENQKLLEQALELTQYTIKLITKVPLDVTYGPGGKQQQKQMPHSLIDRRA